MADFIKTGIFIILLFLLYFGFQIHGINTRYLAMGILCLQTLLIPSYLARIQIMYKRGVGKLFESVSIYNIITLVIPIMHFTMDINMFIGTIRLLICVAGIMMLWVSMPSRFRYNIMDFLIYIYVIQSIIIFLAFLSPSVLDIVRTFQYSNIKEITDRYLDHGTFRGLALSGDQFYGLTASFGLMSLMVIKRYVDSQKIVWMIIFWILFCANMFVGRTGFIGFAVALYFMFIKSDNHKFKLIIKIIGFSLLGFIILKSFLPESIRNTINESVFAYAFQLFYNYKNSGLFETSSSNRVLEMWQEKFDVFTFLFGDGIFMNKDGSYYRHVDVGFLRQLFYGGIVYLIYSMALTYRYLTNYDSKLSYKKHKFEYLVFLYLMATHAKGLAFMYCPEIMMIIFFYYLYINRNKLQSIR